MESLISIIIPMYNSEKYMKKCLDSIINQTYDNFEVLIINDGSTDNSKEICDIYEKSDSRFHVFNRKNSGVSSSRNYGLRKANGYYVTFIDADDYVSPNYLEELIKHITQDIDVVISNAVDVDTNGNVIHKKYRLKQDTIFNPIQAYKEVLLERSAYGTCWGNLYLTDICKKIMFDESLAVCEDMKFLLEYIENSKKIKIINDNLYYYVFNDNSTVHSEFNIKRLDEIRYCELLIKKYNNTELSRFTYCRIERCISDMIIHENLSNKIKFSLKITLKKYFFSTIFFKEFSFKRKIKLLFAFFK